MKKPKQLQLLKNDVRFFGGQLLHGRRRGRRPLSTKDAVHLVMRSSWAKGANSFLHHRNKRPIERLIPRLAKKYDIRVYQKAIAGNHCHLIIRFPNRRNYLAFIRALSGKIAAQVMQNTSFKNFKARLAGDGSITPKEPQGKGQRFWQFRPFSRVLHWGQDFKNCCRYVVQNTLEALGFIPYTERPKTRYAKHIQELCCGPNPTG